MNNVNICGIDFKNVVIGASGTFGFGREYADYMDISKLGGICTKGLTLRPKEGNKGVRVHETPGGMMNSVGLQNPGIDNFIQNELPFMKKQSTVIIANVGGECIEDYVQCCEKLSMEAVDMIEINISCPNVKKGCMNIGVDPILAGELVKTLKSTCKKPMIIKLSPNAPDLVKIAKVCEEEGADGLSLVNTFKAMAVDIYHRKPVFENITAGLSGPGIKPIALRMVYEVCKEVNIPVMGMGGIVSFEDALEFIMCGASAIQVGTGNFIKPDIMIDIINGIENFMLEENIKNIYEIRGVINV